MPGLLHLPTEVLTLIVEEVCITAELENLGQTVTVELCPPGAAVDEGVECLPPLNAQGSAQAVRYSGSRSYIRHQRDELDALIVQRFRKQGVGRVASGSFLHGVHTSHKLERFDQSTRAKVNRLILNHKPDIRCLLALASTCRLLRAYAEPFLYRVVDLDYGNPTAYAKHLELLLQYRHLPKYVRLLSFGNVYDEKFKDDWYPVRLPQVIDRLLAQDAPVSSDELYQQLGPDRFGPHGLHPSIFRFIFLFLLPEVRSLKVDLALSKDASYAERTRREWLFRALLREPNDVWAAGKVPALRNLEEFSLILRGSMAVNYFNIRLLLPFLFLPKMRTFYTSSLRTPPRLALLDDGEQARSQWCGKSPVTEMIFDFTTFDGCMLHSLLQFPRALEKLTVNYLGSDFEEDIDGWRPTDLAVRDALSLQRHSLRKLTLRWANAHRGCSIWSLEEFTVLEELTVPLRMVLFNREDSPRSLREALPASIVRLELLAYNTVSVPAWQPEVLELLNGKGVHTPKLCRLRIEQWLEMDDGPVSKYELDVETVISLGRQVDVEVQVDFTEHKCPEVISSDVD